MAEEILYDTRVLKCGKAVITQWWDYPTHPGIDMTGWNNARCVDYILAHSDGTVTTVGHNAVDGNYIYIQHADGFQTQYCHLADNQIFVAEGDTVQKGDTIAYMGSSGTCTGAHLHFAAYRNSNTCLDPFAYLNADFITPAYETFNIGDKVTLKEGANVYGLSTTFQDWVYQSELCVSQQTDDRVVITYQDTVVGACYAQDLSLIEPTEDKKQELVEQIKELVDELASM